MSIRSRLAFLEGHVPPEDARGSADLSDFELRERTRDLSLRLLADWRSGVAGKDALRVLRRVASDPEVYGELTGQERLELLGSA